MQHNSHDMSWLHMHMLCVYVCIHTYDQFLPNSIYVPSTVFISTVISSLNSHDNRLEKEINDKRYK